MLSIALPVGDRAVKDRINVQLRFCPCPSPGTPGSLVVTLGRDGIECTNQSFIKSYLMMPVFTLFIAGTTRTRREKIL